MDEKQMLARSRIVGVISEFFVPRRPSCGETSSPPVELAIELAANWLVAEGREKAILLLQNGIANTLGNRVGAKGRLSWEEVDTICSQALSLYLKLADEPDIGWVERDTAILPYFTELYWQFPDRIVDDREEKTNCTFYLIDEPCMLKSKEIIFSWITRRWNFSEAYEPAKENVSAAFKFVCDVFGKKGRASGRKTHPDNIRILKSYSSDKYVDEGCILMSKEKENFLRVLKQHCAGAALKDIRPWVRDDLPMEILEVFQNVLVQSGERSVVLQLLKGEPVAA